MGKIKNFFSNKFNIAILLGLAVLPLIAYLDIGGILLIGYEKYTTGQWDVAYWLHFRNLGLIIFSIVPIAYWFFYRKDKSEFLAIYLTSVIGWYSGISDIFYFWLQKLQVPEFLPWLDHHIVIGRISNLIGYPQVTNISLYVSAIVGLIAIYFVTKFLKQKM